METYFERALAPPGLPRSHPGPMGQPAVPAEAAIREEILRQTAARGPERSICPSEVARALAGGDDGPWRPLMAPVRRREASTSPIARTKAEASESATR